MDAWMRALTITLTSPTLKKQISFGANYELDQEDAHIEVSIKKYMSSLKDEAIVKISNLTYSEILRIVEGKFFDIDIWVGYRKASITKVFTGGVYYVSNAINNNKTSTLILICTSTLIAKYGQTRINVTLNSGINMYSAINFLAKRAGIKDANISTQMKKQIIEQSTNVDDTVTSWIDKITNVNTSLITNSDSITSSTFSIFDSKLSNSRVIKLNADNILISGGYPKLTSQGLSLQILPTFNFMCGDTIQIDNGLIDVSVSSRDEVSKSYANYLNDSGMYMIYEMNYELSNRDQSFTLTLKCKNRAWISSYTGR